MSAAPVSIHTAIIASSPLSTMEPDVRDLRAVAPTGGMVNNKETGTICAWFNVGSLLTGDAGIVALG
jgi:hypothetical protein